MPINAALIPRAATRIAPLMGLVDGFPDAVHRLETTVAGEPLEDGRQVTDQAVARQARITLTWWASGFDGYDKVRDSWAAIRRLHENNEVVELVTELGTYRECLIFRAEAPQRGRGVQGKLELRQILRVGVTDSDLPPDNVADGPAEERSGEVRRGRVGLADEYL